MSNVQFYIVVIVPTLTTLLGNSGIILAISIINKRIGRLEQEINYAT